MTKNKKHLKKGSGMFNSMMGKKNVLNSKFKQIKLNNIKNQYEPHDLNTLINKFQDLLNNYEKIPELFQNANKNKLKSIISSVSTLGLEFLRSFQLYLSENNIDLNGKKKSYHELLVGIKNNKTNLIPNILNITLNLVTSIGYLKDGCNLSSGYIRKKGIVCGKNIDKKDLQEIYNTFFFGENKTSNNESNENKPKKKGMLSGLFGNKQKNNNKNQPPNGGGWFGKNPKNIPEAEATPVETATAIPVAKVVSNNNAKLDNSGQIKIANDYLNYIVKLDCIFNQVKNNSYNCPPENKLNLNTSKSTKNIPKAEPVNPKNNLPEPFASNKKKSLFGSWGKKK